MTGDLPTWAMIFAGIGIALLIGELLLPTHGVLGVCGLGGIIAALVCCYMIDARLGTIVLIAAAAASPLVGMLVVKVWPYTPVGRRMVLPHIASPIAAPDVHVGQGGLTVSELRPMGLCEFETAGEAGVGNRIEAVSEYGVISAGRKVQVVALANNRPVVREVTGSNR